MYINLVIIIPDSSDPMPQVLMCHVEKLLMLVHNMCKPVEKLIDENCCVNSGEHKIRYNLKICKGR